jgi:hypothetical protein
MAATLPADVSVVLSLDTLLNVEELAVETTEAIVTNVTTPTVLSLDLIKGDKGDTGAASTIPGQPGPVGPAGPPLHAKGTVPSYANLPTSGNAANDLWTVADTGKAYVWSGSGWLDMGQFTGLPGNAATIAAGTTTTGAPGTNANVTNSGTSSAAVFNFTVPRGDVGATGPIGILWRGNWANGTAYAVNDAVATGGSFFANTGNVPPNATYWAVLAAAGTGGGIPDAPTDGNMYVRKNGAWVIIATPNLWVGA